MPRAQTALNERRQAKVCRGCWSLKPFSAFHSSKFCANGLRSRCKPCEAAEAAARAASDPERYAEAARQSARRYVRRHPEKIKEMARASRLKTTTPALTRRRRLKIKYKMTPEEWTAMFEDQRHVCAICGSSSPKGKHGWSTDHDHATGRVRGILCVQCNHLLGNAGDNEQVLTRAIGYLKNGLV